MPRARRFKLNRDTGITIYTPTNPSGIRLEPGSQYTTDDPNEIDALKDHPDLSEVKIPKREG
jgi:hypothetical protein